MSSASAVCRVLAIAVSNFGAFGKLVS